MKKKVLFFILLFTFFIQPHLSGLNSVPVQAKKAQKELKHEVVVTLKLVQVYVTDKNGNPITDLTKDDFILFDNGKLQTITDFEKHILLLPEKKDEERLEETKLVPPRKIPSRMNRKFLLLLDIDSNDLLGFSQSKKAALHFIDTQLQPSDEVGVFSYVPLRGLVVHEYLTSDHKKVKEAVKRIKGVPAVIDEEMNRMSLGAALGLESSGSIILSSNAEPESDFLKYKAFIFIDAVKELAKSLRYIPGYKNILLFSAGIKRELFYDREDPAVRGKFEDMSKKLASSGSPVYTLNTEGPRHYLKKNPVMGKDSLKMLSSLSGGKYFDDVVHYETIAREIQEVTSNYYVLGYYIDEKWDGRYHEVKVKAKRKGCVVHAQAGYFNPKPFSEFSEFEKQLHLIDLAMSENPYFQVPLRFPLVALPFSQKEKSNLVLLFELSLDEIEEVIKGKAELVTLIFDRENNIVESIRGKLDFFKILEQKRAYAYTISSFTPGEYECRVVLRNLETGKGAVGSFSVVMPERVDSGLKLYPPLLLIPEKKSFFLEVSKSQEEEMPGEHLSLDHIYPFLSNEYSPLIEVMGQGLSKLLAIMRCSIFDIQEPDVELSVHLVQHSSGEKIPLSFSILSAEKEEKTDVLLIELELPKLQPGDYSLEISAEETTTNASSKVTRTFKIKNRNTQR